MVEARGVEPLSENFFLWLSSSEVGCLIFRDHHTANKAIITVTSIVP